MKGQSSFEFLFMVAVFLIILTTFTVPYMINPAQSTAEKITATGGARSACDRIAKAINCVSGSGDNSADSIGISISKRWDLEITSDPPELSITLHTEGETVEIKSELDYGFNSGKISLNPRYYTVIVEKKNEDYLSKSENRVFISLNPGG